MRIGIIESLAGAVLFAVFGRKPRDSRAADVDIGYRNPFNPEGRTFVKTSILAAAVVTGILAVPMASAQDSAVPVEPAMSMPVDAQISQIHTNMTLMQSQMDTIHATTNPTERQTLMQAHMQTMQEGMTMMRSMSKPMPMSGGQRGGMAMGGDKGKPAEKGMMGGEMMKHHQLMQERMGMMQTMMEQMLQHQQVMESGPAR